MASDIYDRLLEERILFLGTPIDDEVANRLIASLLFLQDQDPLRDISFYINSPGGSVTAGMAIYDAMMMLESEITTVCVGQAGGMAALLVSRGTPGKRFAQPEAKFNFVPLSKGSKPTLKESDEAELSRLGLIVVEAFHATTGQSRDKICEDMSNELNLDARGAVEYGLIDAVIDK